MTERDEIKNQATPILSGDGPPLNAFGHRGNMYVDRLANTLYGPKTQDLWNTTINVREDDIQQPVLLGSGAPVNGVGAVNQFYYDTVGNQVYGPYTNGVWGSAIARTVVTGNDAPTDAEGATGDLYVQVNRPLPLATQQEIDFTTPTGLLFGPKGATVWGPLLGIVGPTGGTGGTGPAGPSNLGYGFFYLEPTAGQPTVAIDEAIPFPTTGASSGGIASSSATEILLPAIGVYDVSWMVSVDEAGQLMLSLNTSGTYNLQLNTLAGRATGTNQITNRVLITTTAINSLIKIQNHSSPAALTLTPLPGGTSAGTTNLTVVRLA